jgi:hypothetical protein
MIIGVHCEATLDDISLRELIKMIAIENGLNGECLFRTKKSGGPLNQKTISAATSLFLDIEPRCSFAVFVTDTDGVKSKFSTVSGLVKENLSKMGIADGFAVVACPDPVIEQWFLDEENGIKKILSLNGASPLPYSKETPKARYNKMISENKNKDITKTDYDIHLDVVRAMNIKKLIKINASFNKFWEGVTYQLKSLTPDRQ